jgi:predicted MFS family arabinose efflux permease
MQPVAISWLAFRLTQSSRMLGAMAFLTQVPVFFLGIYAGSIADRFPKRKLISIALVNATLQASLLAALTFAGLIQPWHLLCLSLLLGLTHAFEIPARQAMLGELMEGEQANVIAINATLVTVMRVIGPTVGGYVVSEAGEAWCFTFNALSFVAVLIALRMLALREQPVEGRGVRREIGEGLNHALRTPSIRALMALVLMTSGFGVCFATLLPVIASQVLGGQARLLGHLNASMGAGALLAAVALLLRGKGGRGLERRVGMGATLLGVGIGALSLSRSIPLSMAALALAGFGNITQSSGTLTLLQGLAPPGMRGRLMGLFTTLFIGVTPFGALAVGFAAARFGPTRVLGVQGLVVMAAGVTYLAVLLHRHRAELRGKEITIPPQLP